MIDGVLRVEDVLVDDEGGALGVALVPDADLTDGAVLAEDLVQLRGSEGEGKVADEEDAVGVGG